jgi:hypothetical protein
MRGLAVSQHIPASKEGYECPEESMSESLHTNIQKTILRRVMQ